MGWIHDYLSFLMILLGVNIDHCATLRQARYRQTGATMAGNMEPDPVELAFRCAQAGADGITVHLRKDRRHIEEKDVLRLGASKTTRPNLEMACSPEMTDFALRLKPHFVCPVPESREEITTEGGLDAVKYRKRNIGRSIISRPLFTSIDEAINEMKLLMNLSAQISL